jgi:hypothetical protein
MTSLDPKFVDRVFKLQTSVDHPAVLTDEVKHFIADVAAGSLDRFGAAAKAIERFPAATPEQLLAAAIDLVRE